MGLGGAYKASRKAAGWMGRAMSPSRTLGGAGRGLRALVSKIVRLCVRCGAAVTLCFVAPGSGGLAEGPVSHLGFPRTLGPSAAT